MQILINVFSFSITHLLNLQKKYWSRLNAQQKIAIMDVLLSILEFASSYNSYPNLRMRMHHIPVERLEKIIIFFCIRVFDLGIGRILSDN